METGEVRLQVIPNVKGSTLRKAIEENVDLGATTLVTDEANGYKPVGSEMAGLETVMHAREEYVNKSGFSTNVVEGYSSQCKRSICRHSSPRLSGTLPRYMAEFDFRQTTRDMTDADKMRDLVDRTANRRLTYRPLMSDNY